MSVFCKWLKWIPFRYNTKASVIDRLYWDAFTQSVWVCVCIGVATLKLFNGFILLVVWPVQAFLNTHVYTYNRWTVMWWGYIICDRYQKYGRPQHVYLCVTHTGNGCSHTALLEILCTSWNQWCSPLPWERAVRHSQSTNTTATSNSESSLESERFWIFVQAWKYHVYHFGDINNQNLRPSWDLTTVESNEQNSISDNDGMYSFKSFKQLPQE